jgi:hypothetical protein
MLMEERLPYRIAIMRSGRFQYQLALEAGISETQLSLFLHGRGDLKPDQLARLETVLGMRADVDVPA